MNNPNGAASFGPFRNLALAVQCGCTALVAVGAPYASYRYGRPFALHFGADHTIAAVWPLIVDSLLMIATVELWKPADADRARGRWTAWLAFVFGISLSLCTNIGSTADLSVFGVTLAACPPLALLLAVELLNRAFKQHRAEAGNPTLETESQGRGNLARQRRCHPTRRMRAYYLREQLKAEPHRRRPRPDRRHPQLRPRILRKWRKEGFGEKRILDVYPVDVVSSEANRVKDDRLSGYYR